MQCLQHEPPQPLVALQSRLAALYPEFDMIHLPVGATAPASHAPLCVIAGSKLSLR